jgi:hypothetical protein
MRHYGNVVDDQRLAHTAAPESVRGRYPVPRSHDQAVLFERLSQLGVADLGAWLRNADSEPASGLPGLHSGYQWIPRQPRGLIERTGPALRGGVAYRHRDLTNSCGRPVRPCRATLLGPIPT